MTVDEYEAEDERLWEEYMEAMEEFASEGDERDCVPCYSEWDGVEELRELAKMDEDLSKKERKDMLKWLNERMKDAEDIESKAYWHQKSMQSHESGSDYHSTYAEFLGSIGQ